MATVDTSFPDNPSAGATFEISSTDGTGRTTETTYVYNAGGFWEANGSTAYPQNLDARYIRSIGDRIFGQFHSEINVTGNIDTESRPNLPGPNNGTTP